MDLSFRKSRDRRRRGAFTLLELLVSVSVLAILLVVVAQAVSGTGAVWKRTSNKGEQFREGRAAIESISRTLSQATLNPYWDYQRTSVTAPPTGYIRQSELRFLSGPASALGLGANRFSHGVFFQAPLGLTSTPATTAGLQRLLNTCGYFIEFGSDASFRPSFLGSRMPERYRYRLVEMRQPSDQLTIYNFTSGADATGQPKALAYTGREWCLSPLSASTPPVQVLAENIVAMIVLPQLAKADQTAYGLTPSSLAPAYLYDSSGDGQKSTNSLLGSKNQLPPVIEVKLVAIDEASARRCEKGSAIPDYGAGTLFDADADNITQQLADLETALRAKGISYEVLTAKIAVPGSKWSAP
ncbi:MAG: Verru_Chthon cassette protein C [Terrimicrobiaceae bacterium]